MKRITIPTTPISCAISEAVAVLQSGGIVIYPTETTYGVAVDVENPVAVQKLLAYKGGRDGKAISVAVDSKEMAKRYVLLNAQAEQVYETFLPGPVTVVSTSNGKAAEGIESQEKKVGIRIPKHDLALQLISTFGRGITATGANASNKKRPYAIEDILHNTSKAQQDLIDVILDFGELPHHEPSTVIDTTLDDIVVLRAGTPSFGNKEKVVTKSVEETIFYFETVAKRYRSYYGYKPVIFAFRGEMGAGKTHAVKGLAKGLGISDRITSPTYAFAQEYSFVNESMNVLFVHIDAWRVQNFDELQSIGFSEYRNKKATIALEWSERFETEITTLGEQAKVMFISLEQGEDENTRNITLHTF